MSPTASRLAGAATLLSAYAAAVDVLGGADARWTIAANLLLLPATIVLAAAIRRSSSSVAFAAVAVGPAVAILGALLGDLAGVTTWWLALAGLWLTGVTTGLWRQRAGLAGISAALAVAGALAFVVLASGLPEPGASIGGLRTVLGVAWSGWIGVELLARPLRYALADEILARRKE